MSLIDVVLAAVGVMLVVFIMLMFVRRRPPEAAAYFVDSERNLWLGKKLASINDIVDLYTIGGKLVLLIKTTPPYLVNRRIPLYFAKLISLETLNVGIAMDERAAELDQALQYAIRCKDLDARACWQKLIEEVRQKTALTGTVAPLSSDMELAVTVDMSKFYIRYAQTFYSIAQLAVNAVDAVNRILTRHQRLERLLVAAARFSMSQYGWLIRLLIIIGGIALAAAIAWPFIQGLIAHPPQIPMPKP